MSISYTSKDLIDFSLKEEFRNNNIKFSRRIRQDIRLGDLEVLVRCTGNKIQIINAHISKGNEWKAEFAVQFLNYVITKNNLNLNCDIVLNVDDGINRDQKQLSRLTWQKHKDSPHICVPDALVVQNLIINNHIGQILSKDIPFENKIDKAIFRGSDTGKLRDNTLCQRVEFCANNISNPNIDAKITMFVHFNKESLKDCGIDYDAITCSRTSTDEQLKYKYIIYINGNSTSPDRLVWNLASNSIIVGVTPNNKEHDYQWFSSFMEKENILPFFPEKHWTEYFEKYKKSADIVTMKEKQKYFANMVLNLDIQVEYYKRVLERYNSIFNE
jgi:hypothetical protein